MVEMTAPTGRGKACYSNGCRLDRTRCPVRGGCVQERNAKVIQLITREKAGKAAEAETPAPIQGVGQGRTTITLMANTLLIGGSVAISAIPAVALAPHVFFMFLVGHIIWAAVAVKQRDSTLITLNVGMIPG